jgi:hypothetical protein
MRQFSHSTHSHSLASQKLRYWFGNHTRDCVRGTDSRRVLDLSGKAHRRPLPLQPAQAYSILYYAEGTPLYREIRTLYDKYKEGDKETVDALAHLFNKSSTSKTSPTPTPENGATPSQTDATTPQTDTATPQTDTATPQTDTATAQTDTATAQTDTALPPPRGAVTISPFWPCFLALFFLLPTKFTRHSSHSARKQQKHRINKIVLIQQ